MEQKAFESDIEFTATMYAYAKEINSADELLDLARGQVDHFGPEPFDFTDLREFQRPLMFRSIIKKLEKLRLDFERMGHGKCMLCEREIHRIASRNEGNETQKNSDAIRKKQTESHDIDCISLAIHELLYHPKELGSILDCLFGEGETPHCFPFLDFRKSTPNMLVCCICNRNYDKLNSLLKHAKSHIMETDKDPF